MIPYGRQSISQADIEAVNDVLRSDFLTQGPCVPDFETALCALTGARSAVAVNSATSALHIACLALGLRPGDTLWTTPITFVASANCAIYCGAKVDFVDIDPLTWTMCPNALARKIESYRSDGRPLPKVIVPVHLSGQSADMKAIRELTAPHGIRLIEDASHAIGAFSQGHPVGACAFSDVCVFSFHPVKIVTTGEGGAALTNDPSIARAMALYRSHGITRDPVEMTRPSEGPWYYEQVDLGFNYRMTDIAAALGASQLKRLDAFIKRRNEIAAVYESAFRNADIVMQDVPTKDVSSRHLFIARVPAQRHLSAFMALRHAEIAVNIHYIPVYRQPFYRAMGFAASDFPYSEQYYSEAISLPIYPGLKAADQERVIEVLRKALS
jgi:UDP-4-amino-4,6-dideoxy-N-acetyl-beta-L-altrosamine transaminase